MRKSPRPLPRSLPSVTGYLPGSAAKSLSSMGMSFPAIRRAMNGSGPFPGHLPRQAHAPAPGRAGEVEAELVGAVAGDDLLHAARRGRRSGSGTSRTGWRACSGGFRSRASTQPSGAAEAHGDIDAAVRAEHPLDHRRLRRQPLEEVVVERQRMHREVEAFELVFEAELIGSSSRRHGRHGRGRSGLTASARARGVARAGRSSRGRGCRRARPASRARVSKLQVDGRFAEAGRGFLHGHHGRRAGGWPPRTARRATAGSRDRSARPARRTRTSYVGGAPVEPGRVKSARMAGLRVNVVGIPGGRRGGCGRPRRRNRGRCRGRRFRRVPAPGSYPGSTSPRRSPGWSSPTDQAPDRCPCRRGPSRRTSPTGECRRGR